MKNVNLPFTVKQKWVLNSYAVLLLSLPMMFSSCTSEKLFQSGFDQNTVSQPPSAAQPVGTIVIDGLPGSVVVVNPPVTPSGKWVKIERVNNPGTITNMQCHMIRNYQGGKYTITATLFIPTGCGMASLQFEDLGQSIGTLTSFLHIDFMENNRIRLNDDATTEFGEFPRDAPFIVQVTLTPVNGVIETANIVLGGAGTNGEKNYSIPLGLRNIARNFGTVRFWMGFPHVGAYDVTNIVVRHSN